MKFLISLTFVLFFLGQFLTVKSQTLTNSTPITITKTWSQEPSGWTYPIAIDVPTSTVPEGGFPVCIVLHGFGGNGGGMTNAWKNNLDCHIVVGPTGYSNSWNISDEPSEAPDVEMVGDLIDILQTYSNVNPNQIRILGSSNGSALANRVFIENKDPGIDIVCGIVSHLSEAQYHNGQFYFPSGTTGGSDTYDGYDTPTVPLTGRRYLGVSNTNDGLIPYTGGASLGVVFLDAQYAAFLIAQSQGYTGSQLTSGTQIGASTSYEFSYLDGQVIHLNGDANHSTNPIQITYIVDYFETQCGFCDPDLLLTGTLTSGVYAVSNSIMVDANIPENNVLVLKGNSIVLEAGFCANSNSDVLIEVNPCN